MTIFQSFLMAGCAMITLGMDGGREMNATFPYFVYFLTTNGNEWDFPHYNFTTVVPNTKWRFCMGVLFKQLTVLTADVCDVRANGVYFAGGLNTTIDEIHMVKDVITGRHLLDFRIVHVSNSTVSKWAPLGMAPEFLFERTTVDELRKLSSSGNTHGLVTSFGKTPMIGAMTLLNLDECGRVYSQILRNHTNTTVTLPATLPETVVCAGEAKAGFDPLQTESRFFRDTSGVKNDEPPHGNAKGPSQMKAKRMVSSYAVQTGTVPPGVACPDSMGSPFIIEGGRVLGLLVLSDCRGSKVVFIQTLAGGMPTASPDYVDYSFSVKTFYPPTSTKSPGNILPNFKGETIKPIGWVNNDKKFEPMPFNAGERLKNNVGAVGVIFIRIAKGYFSEL